MEEKATTILVVEDSSAARELLVAYLEQEADFKVIEAGDAATAWNAFRSTAVDLVLLDVMLPDESGIDLCRRMKSAAPSFVPIVLVTAVSGTEERVRGLDAGADDFLGKPILREELIARTRSHLRTKRMMDKIEEYRQEMARFNQRLKEEVDFRTVQLKTAMRELAKAKDEVERTTREIIERLGVAAEYRDSETGHHIRRVSRVVHSISLAYGLPAEDAELLRLAAPMHDIGKMGVRDHVLFKPAQLEEGEAELIRQHTVIGAEILASPTTKLLSIAQQMARSHHERWDGRGYPDGLKGEQIPLPARICAVADVYDAVSFRRVYHSTSGSPEEAFRVIIEGAGSLFDPKVVDAFRKAFEKISANGERP